MGSLNQSSAMPVMPVINSAMPGLNSQGMMAPAAVPGPAAMPVQQTAPSYFGYGLNGNLSVNAYPSSALAAGPSSQPGVDILNESLRYHAQMGGAGNISACQGAAMHSGCMHQHNLNMCGNHCLGHGTACGGHHCGHQYTQAQALQPQSAANTPISSRAVGAIGAAVLMGSFLQNGGVGGMLRSVGWDNKRHIMGPSIGGY
jgi:hypothetical protein